MTDPIPDWRVPDRGTMTRIALWLRAEVGEGETFTKAQLRDAFPNVEQVGRRMRDLRKFGWIFHTKKEEPTLDSNVLRFVREGRSVWERDERRDVSFVPAGVRRAVYARDGFLCVVCGISQGEPYDDMPEQTAVLTIVHTRPGTDEDDLVTECRRCRAGKVTRDVDAVVHAVGNLGARDRGTLRRWLRDGRREPTDLDRLFVAIRQMPAPDRERILDQLS